VLGALAFGRRWDVANAEDLKSDPSEIAKWMDAWMASEKGSKGPLRVGRFADPTYFLLRPIIWEPNPDQWIQAIATMNPQIERAD
jgi:hypothetical protein